MIIVRQVSELQSWIKAQIAAGQSIGFVPTMGFLHAGHISLVSRARSECPIVVASIFVNPTQFAANEDLSVYPRDFENDVALLEAAGCDLVFAPEPEQMYPTGFATTVHIDTNTTEFEAAFRPTHFDGVATVVSKLLLMTKANKAYFGQKDFQQCMIVRRLVADLNIDTEIIICPTIREPDGLAMSSRNVYLDPTQRQQALALHNALQNVQRAIAQGLRQRQTLDEIALKTLVSTQGVAVDYARCVTASDLQSPDVFVSGSEVVCLIAARVGKTRLIDNMTYKIL